MQFSETVVHTIIQELKDKYFKFIQLIFYNLSWNKHENLFLIFILNYTFRQFPKRY